MLFCFTRACSRFVLFRRPALRMTSRWVGAGHDVPLLAPSVLFPNSRRRTQWLTFWLLFTVLEFATTFTDWIGWIIPFYSLGKLGLIIFLGFFNGATMVSGGG